ncbi:hypothetical protein A7A08_00635 [Methyloligella halotolerans]|uniref:DUF6513 domain-containing protein n=1 Tax=Methyloligella halotolerans TaxID=1177755 RepID=A0A1E2S2Y8_9HYPH|nr:hypothetical protein A7A08_00635 [Methyloligella halotolerans]
MQPDFEYEVFDIGVKVAALMTEEIIARRLPEPVEADQVMVPGRCRADLDQLSERFGVPFVRGPDELKDLPTYFGKAKRDADLSQYDIKIFAEIVDASALSVETLVMRAAELNEAGADVIDLAVFPIRRFRTWRRRSGHSTASATRSASTPRTPKSFCVAARRAPTIS